MADLNVYSEAEVKTRPEKELSGWQVANNTLRRQYKTDGWQTTLMAVNTLGYLAETADHHPDLEVSWSKIVVKLQTHSAGGITDLDFDLAGKIEEVLLWRPAKDSPFKGGTSKKWVQGG